MLPAWFGRHASVTGHDYPDARRGAVNLYMPIVAAPLRHIFLPSAYADTLASIYAALPVPRDMQPASTAAPVPAHGSYQLLEHGPNRQRRLLVHRAGADLAGQLATQRQAIDAGQIEVLYVELALDDAAVGHGVEASRQQGLFYGNLLIERRGSDYLRLQYYPEALAVPEAMALYGERTIALGELVQSDRKAVLSMS